MGLGGVEGIVSTSIKWTRIVETTQGLPSIQGLPRPHVTTFSVQSMPLKPSQVP